MIQDAPPPADLETFRQGLAAAVAGARSLDDIAAWVAAQPGVRSVEVAAYLLKSNPPQRDLVVDFTSVDGSIVTKIVNVIDLDGQRFELRTLRDR